MNKKYLRDIIVDKHWIALGLYIGKNKELMYRT